MLLRLPLPLPLPLLLLLLGFAASLMPFPFPATHRSGTKVQLSVFGQTKQGAYFCISCCPSASNCRGIITRCIHPMFGTDTTWPKHNHTILPIRNKLTATYLQTPPHISYIHCHSTLARPSALLHVYLAGIPQALCADVHTRHNHTGYCACYTL